MSSQRRTEHWFDRLAMARHTRRHHLKVAVAAAGLTLPLARARPSQAAIDTSLCQKGCIYSRQRFYKADSLGCTAKYGVPGFEGLAEALLLGSFTGAAKSIAALAANNRCQDRALLAQKYEIELTCHRPYCPGFDPADEWGPCHNCASINGCQCCPDPSAPTGYTYCSSLSNKCCSPAGGCKVCGT